MRTQHRAPLVAFVAVAAACLLMLFHAIHQISPGLPIPSLLADGPTRVFHELVPGSTLDRKATTEATTEAATQPQIEKSSGVTTPPPANTDAPVGGRTIDRSAQAGHRHSANAKAPLHHAPVKTAAKQHGAKPPVTAPSAPSQGSGQPSGQPSTQPTVGVPGLGGVHVPPALGLGAVLPGNSGVGHSHGNGNGNQPGSTGSGHDSGDQGSNGGDQGNGSPSLIGFGVHAVTAVVTPLASAVDPSAGDDSHSWGWQGHDPDHDSPWSLGQSSWPHGHPADGQWPHGDDSPWSHDDSPWSHGGGYGVSPRWAPGRH